MQDTAWRMPGTWLWGALTCADAMAELGQCHRDRSAHSSPLLSRPSREARAGAEAAELRAGTGPGEGGTFGSHLAQALLHQAGSKGQQENRARMDPALQHPVAQETTLTVEQRKEEGDIARGAGGTAKTPGTAQLEHQERHGQNIRNGTAGTPRMAWPRPPTGLTPTGTVRHRCSPRPPHTVIFHV